MEDVLVPITMFLMIFAIVTVVAIYRFRGRQESQKTVRAAIESGQNLSAEVLEQLTTALNPKKNDLRTGIILVSIGVAFIFFANLLGEQDALGPMLGLSAFPLCTGFALLALWFFNRDKSSNG